MLVCVHVCPNHGVYCFQRCLFQLTGIDHRISSAYHPQTNGLDERMNQTLVRSLNKLSETKDNWDQHIDAALYAYRVSRHASSKYSPFFLLYNRHPRMAIDYEITSDAHADCCHADCESNLQENFEETLEHLVKLREHFHSKALTNISKAQEKQKAYYDSRHDSHKVSSRPHQRLIQAAGII